MWCSQPSSILLSAGHQDLKITNFSLARYAVEVSELTCVPKPLDYNGELLRQSCLLVRINGRLSYYTECMSLLLAPEVLSQQSLTPACDLWSMGAVTLFMSVSDCVIMPDALKAVSPPQADLRGPFLGPNQGRDDSQYPYLSHGTPVQSAAL